jgi:hypothetical protein
MNDQETPETLTQLLFPSNRTSNKQADIYVVGVQEGPISTDVIQLRVQKALGEDYCKIAGELNGPINIVVFARMHLTWLIEHAETDRVATKMGGIMRTKGGVGVSLLIAGVRILFVNAHLAAHDDKVVVTFISLLVAAWYRLIILCI